MNDSATVPKNWKIVRLGDVAEIRGNKTVNNVENVAFIPMELIPDSKIFVEYEMRKKSDVKSFTYCESNDLLLAKITPSVENGKQGIVPKDIPNGFALATTEVFPIVCKGDELEVLYLHYLLKFSKFRHKLIVAMTGTTGRQRVPKNVLKNLLIPLPLLPEQRRIAKVLGTIDAAIEKTEEEIGHTERLKKGLMQKLLTRGIGHEKFKDTELGRIPEEWEVVRLGEIGTIITGKTPPTSENKYWENGNIPFITPGDINENKYVLHTDRYVNELGANYVGKIPKNTVFVVCIGSTIGKVGISATESVTNQQINSIIQDPNKADSEYLYYAIMKKSYILKSWAGIAAVPIVKKSLFGKLKLPLPPLPEQRKIAEILSTVDKKLELLRGRREKLERVKKGLMNDLLTGRKRVPEGVV